MPLCALGEVLRGKDVFQPIHTSVSIDQKTVVYRPTDKLVFLVLGMLSGAETVSEINTKVRPDGVLLTAFWLKAWIGEAINASPTHAKKNEIHQQKTQKMLQVRGLKRMRRDILSVPGKVCFEGKRVLSIRLNPLYPLIQHVTTALQAFLKNYNIPVLLDKT